MKKLINITANLLETIGNNVGFICQALVNLVVNSQ